LPNQRKRGQKDVKTRYVICIVFDHDLKQVLLLKRNKDPYKGKLNGLGGKILAGESPDKAALREVLEESYFSIWDIEQFYWIMTIGYGHVELNVYYMVLSSMHNKRDLVETREGKLMWYHINYIKSYFCYKDLAGEGNLLHFIDYSINEIRRKRKDESNVN